MPPPKWPNAPLHDQVPISTVHIENLGDIGLCPYRIHFSGKLDIKWVLGASCVHLNITLALCSATNPAPHGLCVQTLSKLFNFFSCIEERLCLKDIQTCLNQCITTWRKPWPNDDPLMYLVSEKLRIFRSTMGCSTCGNEIVNLWSLDALATTFSKTWMFFVLHGDDDGPYKNFISALEIM